MWTLVTQSSPLTDAAVYYHSKHDYKQALDLWTRALQESPDDMSSLFRVAELKLLLEGRTASRDLIKKYLSERGNALNLPTRIRVKQHLSVIQSRFTSDAGQSHYLQALPKFRRKEFAPALSLFELAANEEHGNLEVLRLKAQCEMELGLREQRYATLKQAYQLSPYEADIVEELSEAHLEQHNYASIIELFSIDPERLTTLRMRMAAAIALSEAERDEESIAITRHVLNSPGTSQFSVTHYLMGKGLAKNPASRLAAIHLLQKFVDETKVPLASAWDPYHLSERMEEARALILTLSRG